MDLQRLKMMDMTEVGALALLQQLSSGGKTWTKDFGGQPESRSASRRQVKVLKTRSV